LKRVIYSEENLLVEGVFDSKARIFVVVVEVRATDLDSMRPWVVEEEEQIEVRCTKMASSP
jgi:hypothetical protein